MSELVRLQKFLAQCGIASRRKAEELIQDGRIKVNGKTADTPGIKIDPERDTISYNGKVVKPEVEKVYLLVNKPKGYVTTVADPQGRPVVTSLVKENTPRLFPVGRLDIDTEGALILTNDGSFAQKVQHPSHETSKTYEALVSGHPGKAKIAQLETGVELEGKLTAPASITVVKHLRGQTLLRITIHEGRKRQVRKMFDFIGNPVINLKRIAYGKLFLKNLPSGSYKLLNPKDLKRVFL